MDRITYVSTCSDDLSVEEIREIGKISEVNNNFDGLTGVLLCYKGLFYQCLEGKSEPLRKCLQRIRNDPRHSDITILKIENNIVERKYGGWKMKTLILDENKDPLTSPIQDLLDLISRSYGALEKYVPTEVLEGIQHGNDPIHWELKRDESIVMFVDLVGFSTMIEKINDLHDLKSILDTFYTISTKAIESTGGKISKLLGDGFMAYYRMDQASQVLKAAVTIIEELRLTRDGTSSPYSKLLYCGVGISAGPLVKGNIGSTVKKDFTLLGDVVNSASRLESRTRRLGYHVLMDQRFKKLLDNHKKWKLLKLGKFKVKGKVSKLTIYTLDLPEMIFNKTVKQIAREINQI